MQDAVRPFAVIRDHHQPLRLDVEPAGGPEAPAARRNEADHRAASALGARRGDEAARLVDGVVHRLLGATHRPAVERDRVGGLVDLLADLRGAPVDRHAAGGDQLLGPTTRGDAGTGEDLLEALSRHRALMPLLARSAFPGPGARHRPGPPRRRPPM